MIIIASRPCRPSPPGSKIWFHCAVDTMAKAIVFFQYKKNVVCLGIPLPDDPYLFCILCQCSFLIALSFPLTNTHPIMSAISDSGPDLYKIVVSPEQNSHTLFSFTPTSMGEIVSCYFFLCSDPRWLTTSGHRHQDSTPCQCLDLFATRSSSTLLSWSTTIFGSHFIGTRSINSPYKFGFDIESKTKHFPGYQPVHWGHANSNQAGFGFGHLVWDRAGDWWGGYPHNKESTGTSICTVCILTTLFTDNRV